MRKSLYARKWLVVPILAALPLQQAWAASKFAPSPSKRVVTGDMVTMRFGTRLTKRQPYTHRLPDGKTVTLNPASEIPGLVVRVNKGVKDPSPQTIQAQVQQPAQVKTAGELIGHVEKEFGARQAYLEAGDVPQAIRAYVGIARKTQVLKAYAALAKSTAMPAAEQAIFGAALEQVSARLTYNIDHQVQIGQGVAADYHPYWSPYSRGLELLHDVAADGPVKESIRHALNYVARRKTALGGRQVLEWDLERSLGMRVVADTDGQESISIKSGTENDYAPSYVSLKVRGNGLPGDLQAHAGKAVYRVGTDYYLDGTGTKLPASVAQHLEEKALAYANITLRRPKPGEVMRTNFKFDWTGSGGIDPTPVDISWWGHCHIEAPLAALGIEAKSKVTYFNAAAKKEVTFDQGATNDLLFAFFDTEQMIDPTTGQAKQVDRTTFVGHRNDSFEGGDQLRIHTAQGTIAPEVRLHEIYDANGAKVDQTFLFQPQIPGANGLTPNAEYLRTEQGDVNVINGNRKVVAQVKFQEWDSNGFERERRQWVTIDPKAPGRALIASQVRPLGGSAKMLTKFYLNLRDGTIESVEWRGEYDASGTFKRTLVNAVDPVPAPQPEEFAGIGGMPKFTVVARGVTGFELAREVQAESADTIAAFLDDAIRHGKGAVVETSPNGQVWNYPMDRAKQTDMTTAQAPGTFQDLTRAFERIRLDANRASTMVARTRDAKGKVKAAEFEAPFLDFAWRPERWVALPFAPGAVNYDAAKRGLLWGNDAQGKVEYTSDFYGMASDVLYLSMVDAAKPQTWGIRHADGKLEYFDSEAEYKARVSQL